MKTNKREEEQNSINSLEESEFRNLITKVSISVKHRISLEQSDVDRISSFFVSDVQKLVFDKLINQSESSYLSLGYFNFEVLSSPSLCETLMRSMEYEKIKNNPDIDSEVKKDVKPSESMLSSLISKNERENIAYLNGEKVDEWTYAFYLKILEIANHFGIDENIDRNRLEEIKLNHLEIWNSYLLETLDSYLGKSFEYTIKGTDETRKKMTTDLLFKKRTKISKPKITKHPTIWKTTLVSIRRLLRFH